MVMNFPLPKEENFGHRTDYLVSIRISLRLIFTTKYKNVTHFGTLSTILHLTTAIITEENYKYYHQGVEPVDRRWPYNAQSLAQTPATTCAIRGEGVSPDFP
jgi:hypothetical protein